MKRKTKIITMAEIAAFASVAFVLDMLSSLYSGFFVSGGSISIAMVPIIILSLRRGPVAGVLCGLIVGLLDLTDGFYTVTDAWYKVFLQVGLDYILTYMFVGLIGLFKPLFSKIKLLPTVVMLTTIAGVGKFMSHFLSGILFWPQFDGQALGERMIYSLVYNGSYMLPSIILTVGVMCFITLKFKEILTNKD